MTIIVGIDDSVQGTAALEWAAREAALRKTPLRILHAFPWPTGTADPRRHELREAAERLVTEAEYWAKQITSDVDAEVVTDGPSHALIEWSRDAGLVVVGTRGRGGFHGLLAGSVALQVAGHASCPVALIGPETPSERREIVLGIGDRAKDETLGWAFAEAALRGARVRALRAWQLYAAAIDLPLRRSDEEKIRRAEEDLLARVLAPWREKYPDVQVVTSLVCDAPRHALVSASVDAGLLVVGAREHDDFPGLALGSVTHVVAHHAQCPVLIAR